MLLKNLFHCENNVLFVQHNEEMVFKKGIEEDLLNIEDFVAHCRVDDYTKVGIEYFDFKRVIANLLIIYQEG